MQKTLTVDGERFTPRQIEKLFSDDPDKMTFGGDYIVYLNCKRYFAKYHRIRNEFSAPVCDKDEANAIFLMSDDGSYNLIWMPLPPRNQPNKGRSNPARKE
jgi:hypothetical protein